MRSKLLPGCIDGLFLVVVVAWVVAFPLPWASQMNAFEPAWWQYVVLAFCGTATTAYIAIIDLWLLYSSRNLITRHAVALALTVPVAMSLAMSSEWVRKCEPSHTFSTLESGILASYYLYYGIFRWISVCVLTLLSVPAQAMTRWRISAGREESKSKTKIIHILLLTASVALSIGVFRPLCQFFNSEDAAFVLVTMAIVELLVLGVFLWPPTLCSFLSQRLQRNYIKTVVVLGMLLGTTVVVFITNLLNRGPIGPKMVVQQIGLFILISFWVTFLISFARLCGLRFSIATALNAEPTSAQTQPGFRWHGIIAAVIVLSGTYTFGYFHSPMPLASFHRGLGDTLACSRQVRRITRALGAPEFQLTYRECTFSWAGNTSPAEQLYYGDGYCNYEFRRCADHDTLLGMLTKNDDFASHVWIQSSRSLPPECFAALSRLDSITQLKLDAKEIAPEALSDFLRFTKVESLELNCELSKPHLAALASGQVDRLSLGRCMLVDSEDVAQLRKLPVQEINLQYDDPDEISFAGFDSLIALTVKDSKLTREIIEGIPKHRDRIPLNLHLEECELTPGAIDAISRLDLNRFSMAISPTDEVDEDTLLRIADNKNRWQADFKTYKLGQISPLFAPRFDRRLGKALARVTYNGADIDLWLTSDGKYQEPSEDRVRAGEVAEIDDESTSVLTWAVGKYGSLDRAVEEVAHKISRDDDGQIVELDLQWISFPEELADAIAKLPSLKRLRYSFWNRSHEIDKKLLNSKTIESLEIPNTTLPKESIPLLASMTQLKRLQLPQPILGNYTLELAFPEAIPISGECCHFMWSELQMLRREAEEDSELLGPSDINQLRTLEALEYLFVPGHFLDVTTIKTIESFKQLREFHAPFSGCNAQLLIRLSKLKQLRSLSVGIAPDVPQDKRKLAAQFIAASQHLKTLQLFICDQTLYESTELQQKWRAELQGLMAEDAELHLIATPE